MGNSLKDGEIAAILQRSGIPRAAIEVCAEIALRPAWPPTGERSRTHRSERLFQNVCFRMSAPAIQATEIDATPETESQNTGRKDYRSGLRGCCPGPA
jgi:hypothetical protein